MVKTCFWNLYLFFIFLNEAKEYQKYKMLLFEWCYWVYNISLAFSSPSCLKDSPPFLDADDVLLLQPFEKSPMFSSSTIDEDMFNSILDSDSECTVPDAFSPTTLHTSPSCIPHDFSESPVDILADAFSPDIDVNGILNDFINSPNILNSRNLRMLPESDNFVLDSAFQDRGYPNIPLTPWISSI